MTCITRSAATLNTGTPMCQWKRVCLLVNKLVNKHRHYRRGVVPA
jgi:hypothetical protein